MSQQEEDPSNRASEPPTREQILFQLDSRSNWGRWGRDDQLGALNLVSAEQVRRACSVVTLGTTLSLSREVPTRPRPGNPKPALHVLSTWARPHGGGAARDYCGVEVHGYTSTHVDALCHLWGPEGMWGGRDPAEVFEGQISVWGDIDQWRNGIVTRCALLDVPAHRDQKTIVPGGPVHGSELEAILSARGITLHAGDAIAVYGGRDHWEEDNPSWMEEANRPGLHISCIEFLRDHDVSVLCWDFLDAAPCASEYDLPYAVHAALYAFGVALVDNCHFGELVPLAVQHDKYEFMLVVAPLRIVGGTGSPVNPIAVL